MVDNYAGNDLLYFNSTGLIPEQSVVVKGVKRPNPFREKRIFDSTSFPAAEEVKKRLEEEEPEDVEEEVLDKRHLEETEG